MGGSALKEKEKWWIRKFIVYLYDPEQYNKRIHSNNTTQLICSGNHVLSNVKIKIHCKQPPPLDYNVIELFCDPINELKSLHTLCSIGKVLE